MLPSPNQFVAFKKLEILNYIFTSSVFVCSKIPFISSSWPLQSPQTLPMYYVTLFYHHVWPLAVYSGNFSFIFFTASTTLPVDIGLIFRRFIQNMFYTPQLLLRNVLDRYHTIYCATISCL